MEVRPTPEQQALIDDAIRSGRLDSAEAAIQQALALWEQKERYRIELIAASEAAEEDYEGGHCLTLNNSEEFTGYFLAEANRSRGDRSSS